MAASPSCARRLNLSSETMSESSEDSSIVPSLGRHSLLFGYLANKFDGGFVDTVRTSDARYDHGRKWTASSLQPIVDTVNKELVSHQLEIVTADMKHIKHFLNNINKNKPGAAGLVRAVKWAQTPVPCWRGHAHLNEGFPHLRGIPTRITTDAVMELEKVARRLNQVEKRFIKQRPSGQRVSDDEHASQFVQKVKELEDGSLAELAWYSLRYVAAPTTLASCIPSAANNEHGESGKVMIDARAFEFDCNPSEKEQTTLKLVVNGIAFENYLNGYKRAEMRTPSNRNMSLLYDKTLGERKKHRLIEIRHGYGKERPFFTAEISGYARKVVNVEYPNGLHVRGLREVISIGRILELKNLHPWCSICAHFHFLLWLHRNMNFSPQLS